MEQIPYEGPTKDGSTTRCLVTMANWGPCLVLPSPKSYVISTFSMSLI